ncbi:MAG: threonylcarbamoyl-AMP synthase [Muribaculaceae bacterium]|nr:threonylcarbamoyl-AMP synthase [Muribaculaceae bacterium]
MDTFNEDLKKAVEVLRAGGVILYPTDTIWGLGCDATNPQAVEKIFKIKNRADSKSMLSLVGSDGMLQQYVEDVPDIAWELIDAAVNPLTIIYDRPRGIAANLLADDGSAGFRITHERFSQALCQRLRRPVVSTSANISGAPSPRSFNEIDQAIIEAVDYAVQSNRNLVNSAPSNIIKISDYNVVKVIR